MKLKNLLTILEAGGEDAGKVEISKTKMPVAKKSFWV